MGKRILYIITGVCVLAILLFLVFRPRERSFDKRVILDKNYKIPYGLYVTRNLLPASFSGSKVWDNRQSPAEWYNEDSAKAGNSLFFLVSEQFNPNKEELNDLLNFVENGNHVFICTSDMNQTAKVYFGIGEEFDGFGEDLFSFTKDSAYVSLLKPPYNDSISYFNPGYNYTSHFFGVDSLHYNVLGKDSAGYPNFIAVRAGKGSFYLHSNPLLFANYFLLYKNNLGYLQNALSLIPADKKKIIWDEYFMYRASQNNNKDSPSPFRVLWAVPAFRWAFIVSLVLLALYIILGAKLMQRVVPLYAKPKNETLEFAKTIGRLYYEKGDHTNLAGKMATYVLEHIRNRYFIKTTTLDDDFILALSSKSGYSGESVKEMVGHLNYIQSGYKVTEQQLAEIYASFSKFYKHTS